MTNDETTYSIVRFYHPDAKRENEVIATGLTLEQAKAHCNDPSTSVTGKYFDGFKRED